MFLILKLLNLAKNCPTMKYIIQLEPVGSKDIIDKAEKENVVLKSYGEVLLNVRIIISISHDFRDNSNLVQKFLLLLMM